jgi:hypothetical protein
MKHKSHLRAAKHPTAVAAANNSLQSVRFISCKQHNAARGGGSQIGVFLFHFLLGSGTNTSNQINVLRIKLGMLWKAKENEVLGALDGMSMKVVCPAGVEHDWFASL